MKLTVLGTQASYALPGRANASYLVSDNGTNVLLDIGNGSLSNLFNFMDPADLDAIVITHLHSDHFGDIYPLRLYLYFEKKSKVKLYLPKGGKELIGRILSDSGKEAFDKAFDFQIIPEQELTVGNLKFSFKQVCHLEPTYGVSVSSENKKFVYSADTAYCDQLIDLAKDSDLLLAEATFPIPMMAEHLTASEAGLLAKEANCRKLVLTHIWPSIDHNKSLSDAKKEFNGEVILAKEGDVYEI